MNEDYEKIDFDMYMDNILALTMVVVMLVTFVCTLMLLTIK